MKLLLLRPVEVYKRISIRQKVLTLIGVASLIMMVLLIMLSRFVVLGSFEKLEEQAVKKNVDRVYGEIKNENKRLMAVCYDYAVWDKTYQYMTEPFDSYLENNIYPETFTNIKVNFYIMMTHDGKVIYSTGFNAATQNLIPVSNSFLKQLASHDKLRNPGPDGEKTLLMYHDTPALWVSRQIINSKGTGPSRGALIVGEFLDQTEIKRISELTHHPSMIYPLQINRNKPELINILSELSTPDDIIVKSTSADQVTGYTLLKDLDGKSIAILEVNVDRDILKIGEQTIQYSFYGNLGIVFVFVLLLILSLDKIILNRLSRHTKKLSRLADTGDLSMQLDVIGSDELSYLAITINKMITELEKFQALTNRKRVHEFSENSLVGICILQNKEIVFYNAELEKILGQIVHTDIGDQLKILDFNDSRFIPIFEVINSIDCLPLEAEKRIVFTDPVNGDEVEKWIHMRSNAIEYEGQDAILLNMVDVTKFKELEKVILVREKMASLGSVAAGIAHEIRNPLSGINFTLDAVIISLEETEDLDGAIKLLKKSKFSVRKMESVVKRVLDFSKPHKPQLKLADIDRPIADAVSLSRVTLRKQQIQIDLNLSKTTLPILIDSHLIEQVMLNLINNSAEAMSGIEGDKQITINTTFNLNYVAIIVADNGPGVPVAIRSKIFDPFFTTKNDGSGIGLSICQRIIADHSGTIQYSHSAQAGSEFKIKIPIGERG